MEKPAASGPESSRLARDSAIVGVATVASRLLGFARDVLIARLLGGGPVADAFLAALRLPNLVRRVLGEGGLNAPFVPLYLAIKGERGAAAAQDFAGAAAGRLSLLLLVLVGLGELFAPWLVLGLAGGFAQAPETLALAASYTRLMLPFLFLTTLAAMLAALLNAEKRFAVAALAPALMNAILLAVLLMLHARATAPEVGARWLALATSLTGLAHLAMILMALRGRGLPRPSLRWSPDMTRFLRTGGATLIAASAAQLVLLVATQIASTGPGAVAALYYADRVFQLPLGFVGVAMGTVVLSDMALAAERDGPDALLGQALALGLALALPAATALVALADPIVSVLFEHGRFDAADRARTAAALAALGCGLPFAVAAKVFGQVYFARRAPCLPLLSGVVAVAVAALFGFGLARAGNAARIAALAATLAFVAQALLLGGALLRQRIWRPGLSGLRPIAASLGASAIMLAVLALLMALLAGPLAVDRPVLHRVGALGLICLGGLASYGAAGWMLGAFGALPLRKRRG
ncbi:murein biosynthesis integral membrane protein MurJ [Bosea sp. (in: a-proteobacteria)]|uniref:murein biosynthesis integral membrane protein MurJ n=1 Tax=Bosea sp. (in: a-proteobacteria) TaxID=1871050 RepID=UPI00262F8856|nr:murein biosynthesis integral membrane protein MurJ [Bosea sp. (in: a-proteobacteria)]MCO5090486.1 murein biosynthesis integral membrane protein MurJ [Bosea sp. (in: a-proteobacteria)]